MRRLVCVHKDKVVETKVVEFTVNEWDKNLTEIHDAMEGAYNVYKYYPEFVALYPLIKDLNWNEVCDIYEKQDATKYSVQCEGSWFDLIDFIEFIIENMLDDSEVQAVEYYDCVQHDVQVKER